MRTRHPQSQLCQEEKGGGEDAVLEGAARGQTTARHNRETGTARTARNQAHLSADGEDAQKGQDGLVGVADFAAGDVQHTTSRRGW